ncbi:MAG: hypothetical protein AB4368_04160 [Xenococcaceae cyanobacterium]
MQPETIFKTITAIFAIVGVGKTFYEMRTGNRSRLREEYKFAKDFLAELDNNPNLHPFALEKGYQAIAGSTTVSTEEIAYLLSLKNPGKCLNDYLLGKKYLSKLDTDSDFQLYFSKKYSTTWSRKWRKYLYLTLALIFACSALSPFLRPQYFPFRLLIITMPVYGVCTFWCLDELIRIDSAEQLVKNQQEHLSKIHLPQNSRYTLK